MLGKEKFPYAEAALRSVQIWHQLTRAKVVMTLVHSDKRPPKELLAYKDKLEGYGADVVIVKSEELSCVLTSQLIRIIAHHYHPIISDDDIVITADVDAFIMTPDILKPLSKDVSVWIWRYELSYVNGYTFMMPFIGARSRTWQKMIWFQGSLQGMVDHYRTLINITETETWDIDQDIVTYSILTNKLCSLQESNKVWSKLHLEPAPFNDHDTCYRGSGVNEDCNNVLWQRNAMIKYKGGGCKWWHFYPYEGVKELEEKFQEIMSGKANNNLMDKLLKGVSFVQDNILKQFMSQEEVIREDPAGELEIWKDHKS